SAACDPDGFCAGWVYRRRRTAWRSGATAASGRGMLRSQTPVSARIAVSPSGYPCREWSEGSIPQNRTGDGGPGTGSGSWLRSLNAGLLPVGFSAVVVGNVRHVAERLKVALQVVPRRRIAEA